MSRIFDALQRASLERESSPEYERTDSVKPFAAPGEAELPLIEDEILPDRIVRNSWKPMLDSLPTLGERGESIEQFRGLRTQLYQYRDQVPLKTILVSSGLPAEGKTFVAANLAVSLARNQNSSVLLIDADLRKPTIHTILGSSHLPGLAEYLSGSARVIEILQRNQDPRIFVEGQTWQMPDLTLIASGEGGDHSAELVANHRFEELITALSPHFDWIIIDSPPALVVADAIDLARAADAVLLVARASQTPFDVAQRAQAAFVNSRLLGFVLNAVKDAPRGGGYYYYGNRDAGSGSYARKG
jgi:capsular exopolysaccharide synthesis family protein